MIDSNNIFDQPINSKLKTYENIRKTVTVKGDYYTIGCLFVVKLKDDCNRFK